MDNALISRDLDVQVVNNTDRTLLENSFNNIRDDMKDNPYIKETLRVLPVGGYRSAIGSFWNAVVDDLRNKIIVRGLDTFNKEMKPHKPINKYEDFQDYVNDELLIDGAYKIGIIDWEAHKVLKQAKETRHIFDGHPKSSEPDLLKVLSMINDCIKYVLSKEYPTPIINIDEYISNMGSEEFDRNDYSISNAMTDLPDEYKKELINRLFSSYINNDCSSILRSNIEVVAPELWKVIPKETAIQITHRVDKEIPKGNSATTEYAFSFIDLVNSKKYLSTNARKYKLAPIIKQLLEGRDNFQIEDKCVSELYKYAGYVPRDLLYDYVYGLTQTFVGRIGGSAYYQRTDFYADGAALKIPKMFQMFDDESAHAFIESIKCNKTLQGRIRNDVKLSRLRTLAEIVYERISERFSEKDFLELLIDEERKKELFDILNIAKSREPL